CATERATTAGGFAAKYRARRRREPRNLVVARPIRYQIVMLACYGGRAGVKGRSRGGKFARRLSSPRAQRRFSPAQLFPAVAVVVAGRGEGGVSRPRLH